MADKETAANTGAEAGSALAGAGVGLLVGGLPGAVLGAVTPAAVKKALEWVADVYSRRREANMTAVIALAAQEAGLDPQELVRRLDADPAKREVFVRTLKAAADAGRLSDLVALAQSLSRTATSDSERELRAEATFVRALDDLDSGHIHLLAAFVKTSNQNNLGDGSPDFDRPVEQLNDGQLALCLPGYEEEIPALLAGLQTHGLVAYRVAPRVTPGGLGVSGGGNWHITSVGRAFLDRMHLVDRFLSDHGESPGDQN